jgi:hypothetical protein
MDLSEIGREGVDWIHLAQAREPYEPYGSIKDGEFLD